MTMTIIIVSKWTRRFCCRIKLQKIQYFAPFQLCDSITNRFYDNKSKQSSLAFRPWIENERQADGMYLLNEPNENNTATMFDP